MRHTLASLILATSVASCGGGSDTTALNGNNGNNNPPGGNPNGSVKVVTATINGVAFTGTTVVGGYLNGSLTINATNAQRSITMSAINVAGPETIALGVGNQWSALAQVIGDNTAGTYSTGFGGTGTLTLTTATLFRITGTFTFTAYTVAGGGLGQPVVTVLNGTFDISSP